MRARFVRGARRVGVARDGELLGEEVDEDFIGRDAPVAAQNDHLAAFPHGVRVAVQALPAGEAVVAVGGVLDEAL